MQEQDSSPAMLPPEPAPAPPSPLRSAVANAVTWFRDLVFSVLIAIVMIVFIYQPVKVEGTSMMPTLTNEERIFINKFTYRFGLGGIERGDTVVFWYPGDTSKSYIKRVIGIPGDRIRVDQGQVYVNGQALVEDYVPQDYRDYSSWHDGQEQVVPEGRYFVLGDHRNQSSDSRMWGYVPRENIYGKAVFVYWPLDKIGRVR
ncbi:MAG TPA: signal peptidase I [Bryobacteraceae bacterium]|jgi:signal peptidase I|nr:signal peptidase I [Bryobacteraceae bacterium]